ncbi:hypothetical protein [Bradyrhizobium sp. CCGB20]|uniref:hypothetical protein n=1 Tax=Bradyrhizobium sp. CCGB20 TaxID=2949633 RepID=UPI0020B226EC|nr:hypothetical protein [Bradyrhizobium sp. CCGB20]MCP3399191.1 hypothetical protein [Bradyrhizobium sp. CCGB20]
MRKLILALMLLAGCAPLKATGAPEHCDKPSAAGIKRCEEVVASKDDPTTTWKTVTYSDRSKNIVDLEITFPRKMGEPIYVTALIVSSMAILSPELTTDERGNLFKRLVQNASKEQPAFISAGKYEWTSFRTASDYTFRATKQKK